MGLMRSLQAGITGLRNHQLFMDVVGNNIANVNTVGFKVGRVTFSEMFAQTIRGTTQPVASAGGTNPIQVGLGMAVGTIDTIHTMGSLETTGQGTDLAIQGDGFFVLDDAGKRVYTRAGVFQFNADGVLTMPSNGLKVQGFLATPDGEIDPAAGITDIQIPGSLKLPASATNQITFNGNLNAKLEPTGSILKSGGVYAIRATRRRFRYERNADG
ncbi:MAG: flagellar hook-basal body complex protein [Calditrichia bacterium]